MRPILALNYLLQIEQERPEEESSVGDALALAFRCARFCSASLILFVPRLFEEKWRDTVFGFPWGVVRGAWRVVRGSEFLVGTLSP